MIIGVIGYMGSGKDTVSEILVQKHQFTKLSFAGTLKDATADIFNWPRHLLEGDTKESRDWREQPDAWWSEKLQIKDFTPRLALQMIGTQALRNHFHKDIWIYSLQAKLKNAKGNIVISDTRFKNEIEILRSINAKIVRVDREKTPEWYDIAVSANNGNLEAHNIMTTKYKHIHLSEWDWAGTTPDFIIQNTGTLKDLEHSIDELVKNIQN